MYLAESIHDDYYLFYDFWGLLNNGSVKVLLLILQNEVSVAL
jgi:hypothetical protein